MERCENCGNAYEKSFKVTLHDGETHSFDSFECAINKMAPRCYQCKTAIIGHGLENGEEIYCCASCARANGVTELADHVGLN